MNAERMLSPELTLSAVADRPTEAHGSPTAPRWRRSFAMAIALHLSPRAGSALANWDRSDAIATRASFVEQAMASALECPGCRSDLGLPPLPVETEAEARYAWGDR